jgi:GAF domain-containing protein
MGGDAGNSVPEAAVAAGESIERSLRATRELLGMEIAWIAEFRDGTQVFRSIDGDGQSFGFNEGGEMPLDATYCERVMLGVIPNLIPDTADEPGVRDLEVTATAGIASYVGVPIQLVDGTVFGTLCCASHRPNGDLTEKDVEYLRGISRRVAASLEDLRIGPGERPAGPGQT